MSPRACHEPPLTEEHADIENTKADPDEGNPFAEALIDTITRAALG